MTLNGLKRIIKEATKDKVDVAMFILAVCISIIDFATKIDLEGGLAFLTVYISSLIYRMTF
jgi:hypothetical protein